MVLDNTINPNRNNSSNCFCLFVSVCLGCFVCFVLIKDKRFGFEHESECTRKLFAGCSAVLVSLVMGETHVKGLPLRETHPWARKCHS